MGKEQRGATGEKEQGRAREIERERVGERQERDPQSKRPGLTGAKGGGGFELTRVGSS